jgi:hypothetical protein
VVIGGDADGVGIREVAMGWCTSEWAWWLEVREQDGAGGVQGWWVREQEVIVIVGLCRGWWWEIG